MSFAYLHECFPDPTKTFVYREVAAMVALGMEPLVFSVREPNADERARMESFDVTVRYVPPEAELRALIERERDTFSAGQRRALSHWRAQKGDSTRVFEALWLGRELRRLKIRHVHAHFAGLAARTAWLVRELFGIGYSFTGHADDIFSPEQKPITLEMLVRNARFIATETDFSRVRLEQEFAAARGKTFRVFNGLDSARLTGDFPARPSEDVVPRIVSVGRLVEKKGFPDLLRACAELKQAEVTFICEIIGSGPMEAELERLRQELGLTNEVVFRGAQPQRVVQESLRSARVFALAARVEGDGGSDNLPTVIMEAMAEGLPIVSTTVAGIPEMVDAGETGILGPPGDVRKFAEGLQHYLQHPAEARLHGSLGKKRAAEKFSVAAAAARLAELLVQKAGVQAPPALRARLPTLRSSWLCRFWKRFGRVQGA